MDSGEVVGELAVRITADSTGFGEKLEQSVSSTSQKILGGVSVASAAGLAATAGAVTGLYKIGETLDEQYDKIRIGTGATGEALQGLQDSFTNVANSVPADMDSVGTAVADLNTRLGLTGPELEGLSKQFLELARITDTDVGGSIETVTALFNQFNVTGDEQRILLDDLFQASQASGVGVNELADAVNKGGAVFQQFGLTVNQSADLLALLGKNGITTREATMGLNKVLVEASKAGVPAKDALQFFSDAIKNAGSEAEAAAIGIETFGPRAGAKLAAQIRDGTLSMEDFGKQLGKTEDTIIGVGAETMDFAESMTMLKNSLTTALGPAASKLFDTIGKSATQMAPSIIMIVEAMIPLIEAFASLPAPVLAGLIGVFAAGAMIGKLAGPIMTAVKAFKLLSAAMMANPWILLIAATIALGIVIVKNWDTIKEAVGKALEWIQEKIAVAWEYIKVIWTTVWEAIAGFFTDVWERIKGIVTSALSVIQNIVSTVWNVIAGIVTTVMGIIQGIVTTGWTIIQGIVTTVMGVIQGIITTVWDTISGIITTVMGTIQTIITTGWGIIQGAITTAVTTIQTIVQTAWDTMRSVIETGMDVVRGVIETAWGLIVGVFEFAKGLIDGIIGGVVSTIDTIGNAVTRAWEIVNLAWDWIVGKFVWAKDQIIRLASEIKNAALDALGPVGDIIGGVGGIIGGGLDLLGFDTGGVVPGPKGAPRLVIAHGGETILPTHKPGYVQQFTTPRLDAPLGASGGPSSAGPVVVNVTLNDATIRSDHDVVLLARELGREQERLLNSKGVRTTAGGLR